MRTIGVVSFLVLIAAAGARGDEWQKRFPVSGRPELRVDTGDGSIELNPGPAGEISARVLTKGYKIGSGEVEVTDRQTGNRVEIEVRIPNRHWNIGNRSVRVELTVPANLDANLRTGDGSVRGRGVGGDLRIVTGDGSIDLGSATGSLDAHTGDGKITADGRFERLSLKTGDGSIDARIAEGSQMAGSWRIDTGDGSVTLRLPASFASELDLKTGDGGITVDLPATTNGRVSEHRFHGKLNGGGQVLTITTGDGSIRVGRL